MGFIIGDGPLNYAPESIAEAYCAWQATRVGGHASRALGAVSDWMRQYL